MDIAPCSTNMGRIFPPFVFGVIMLIRFFLLYLITFSAFADCPAGESIGNYPVPTSLTICVNYINNNCVAKCGYSTSSDVLACVDTAQNRGPYRLTGASCEPHEPGGLIDCSLTPTDPSCFVTPPDCTANPSDPACAVQPPDCSLYPNDPVCGTINPEATGSYTDSNGFQRSFSFTTGLNPSLVNIKNAITNGVQPIMESANSKLSQIETYTKGIGDINDSLDVMEFDSSQFYDRTAPLIESVDSKLNNLESINGNISTLVEGLSPNGALNRGLLYMARDLGSIQYNTSRSAGGLEWISSNTDVMRDTLIRMNGTLTDIGSKLSNSASSGSGTGSGGGDGSGTGPSVGSAENPAHVASSLYKSCADCVVDVDGAQSELDASKEKLKTTIKTIQTDFKNIFTFDSGAGSGTSVIASCWDFGDLIGKKCMQVDETWALLKALVLFIFLIAIVFMFTRGN